MAQHDADTAQGAAGSRAEAEYKVQISADEFDEIPGTLERLGFQFHGVQEITDVFVEREKEPGGRWNFERIRIIDEEDYVYTRKTWEVDGAGQRVRREEERPASREEFLSLTHDSPDLLSLHKVRRNYAGVIDGMKATVSLDTLDVSDWFYHFLECEVLTTLEQGHRTRERIRQWMAEKLDLEDLTEAPSMVEIAQLLSRNQPPIANRAG